MLFFLSGGGTLGSVMPLLALAAAIKDKEPTARFFWLGTGSGPERQVIQEARIEFRAIPAGKLRHYFDWRTLAAPFLAAAGFFCALFQLIKARPKMIITAGGFVGVPVVWAGWLLRIPVWAHQQDVVVGLANRLIAPFARKISVVFSETAKFFLAAKTVLSGNPVRAEFLTLADEQVRRELNEEGKAHFGFSAGLPTVLVIGGGTGAVSLNKLVSQTAPELTAFCQVLHITGPGKEAIKFSTGSNHILRPSVASGEVSLSNSPRYKFLPFVSGRERLLALAVADLAISRAGMGAISEFAAAGIPMILAPMENSHQEANAAYLERRGAAQVILVSKTEPKQFAAAVKDLLGDKAALSALTASAAKIFPQNAADHLADKILALTGFKYN